MSNCQQKLNPSHETAPIVKKILYMNNFDTFSKLKKMLQIILQGKIASQNKVSNLLSIAGLGASDAKRFFSLCILNTVIFANEIGFIFLSVKKGLWN